MKNVISIILVLALLAGFAACKKLPEGSYKADSTTNKYAEFVGEGETVSPELEQFLDSFDSTDPAEIEQQFEQMLEEEIEVPDMEFGEELIDDSNSSKIEVELDENGRPEHDDNETDYAEIMNSEKFTIDVVIKTKTNGEEIKLPIVAMRDGQKVYFEAVMPVEGKGSMRFNMLLSDDGNCYLVFPAMRAYMKMPVDAVGDIFPSDIVTEDTAASGTYIETREVEVDGKTYICEIYKDGEVDIKYYYDNGQLKRVETISGDDITIMEINDVKDTSDASKFNVPKNYFDLTTVMGSSNFDLEAMY